MKQGAFVGGGGENYAEKQFLKLNYANRHRLIAGATGTGKTVTLQILAEEFSAAGVPVFMADVKGDLSGIAASGRSDFKLHEAFQKRAALIGFDTYSYDKFPVTFWDLFGEKRPSSAHHRCGNGSLATGAIIRADRGSRGDIEHRLSSF